jgi:hypothetical protein
MHEKSFRRARVSPQTSGGEPLGQQNSGVQQPFHRLVDVVSDERARTRSVALDDERAVFVAIPRWLCVETMSCRYRSECRRIVW